MSESTEQAASDPPQILQKHFDEYLSKREPPKTFCPSEVARALSSHELQELELSDWRAAMPLLRELAWDLKARGRCEVLQKGQLVDEGLGPEEVKGPIRIRRVE